MFRPLLAAVIAVCATSAAHAGNTTDMLKAAGVKGGIIVQIGVDSGDGLADLLINDRYIIQGLETDAEKVAKARAKSGQEVFTGRCRLISLAAGSCRMPTIC